MAKKATGGGLRERKKQATRTALAEAAVRLAAEHGAEGVTVEAISEAAGVSPRTFFNYFDTRDDAFAMIDAGIGERVRQAVLDAPAELPPLTALRDALAAELAGIESRHELWDLWAEVLHASPHLLVRSMGAHLADELALARAVTQRLRGGEEVPEDEPPGLYPRLVAAVAATAVRVSVAHWSAQGTGAAGRSVPFAEIFRETFAQLSAGLPAPGPGTD
ncbi:TetR/AcrR family transcriptional regulator [Streptomyces sp. HNM0574]|uniref:TetR/AcrR family transcriptional regulator n=1 Tax=Streptomyces sp. HNM0574 TaxID=2714954 RepID=UPI0019D093CE|nr:TetR/AcrR family transcriptional regulator [Streptomyces sp. HNM0574]